MKDEKDKKPQVADFGNVDDMIKGIMSGKIDPMHLEVATKTKDFENFCFSAGKLMDINALVITSVGINMFIHGMNDIACHTLNKDIVEQTMDGAIKVMELEKQRILDRVDEVKKAIPEDLEKKLRDEFKESRKRSEQN